MSRRRARRTVAPGPGELENKGHALTGAALHQTSRLRDHIERLDEGAAHAIDDIASVLRVLLCSGTGNRVLMRLAATTGRPAPRLLVSKEAPLDPDVFFAVGAIPTAAAAARDDGATEVTLTKWMTSRVLTVTSAGSRVPYTWDRFISTYVVKWGGTHLDEAVPAHLQMIDHHTASGMPLSNYLLRCAAVTAWAIAQGQLYPFLLTKETIAAARGKSIDTPIYSAPGSVPGRPRDISDRGVLQLFCHRTDAVELLWYVDDTSPNNALHLTLGQAPYDIRYGTPAVPAAQGPVPVVAQRQLNRPAGLIVVTSPLKKIPVNGRVRTLRELEAAAGDIPSSDY